MGNIPNDQVKDYLSASDCVSVRIEIGDAGHRTGRSPGSRYPGRGCTRDWTDDIIEDGVNGFLTEEREEEWAAK